MSFRKFILLSLILCPRFSSGQNLVVTNTHMNILYIGIDNEIQFASRTVLGKDFQLVPQRGEIHEFEGRYFYRNCKNEAGELMIYARSRKTSKILDSVIFRLKHLPEPSIRFVADNMSEGVYTGNNILKDIVALFCHTSGDFEMPITILSFRLKVRFANGKEQDFVNEGNRFSSSLRDELAALTGVVRAEIEEIRVIMGCVKTTQLLSHKLTLRAESGR